MSPAAWIAGSFILWLALNKRFPVYAALMKKPA